MTAQPSATIFLGDQRGLQQTASFQSRYTFNFGNYFNEHRHAYGDLYVFNDDCLAGGAAMQLTVQEDSCILLIPVAGAVNYKDTNGNITCIAAGQVQVITAGNGDMLEISNPFPEEMVNCLQVWIRMLTPAQRGNSWLYTYEDVNKYINQLINALPLEGPVSQLPVSMSIGKFSGRGECLYKPEKNNGSLFLFVIEGAFEVEGRLLHAGDALALWNNSAAEIEALSNDAILLAIALPAV
jgi:quercetin 2,3-dioxygenase